MSAREIKSRTIGDIRYSITYWPENEIYQIHYSKLVDDRKTHLEPEIAKFDNEKDAEEFLNSIEVVGKYKE